MLFYVWAHGRVWTHLNHPFDIHLIIQSHACVCALTKLFQSYPTLCNPMDCSPPGSSVHEILQARILYALLQGIFPTQESNLCLLHLLLCKWILYHCAT